MSWLDFFRNRIGIRKEEEGKTESKSKITIEEVKSKIQAEHKDIDDGLKEIRSGLRERILQLESEVEAMIRKVMIVNFEERREDERLKFIVKQHRDAYISNLHNLLEQLKSLDSSDAGYLFKVQTLFSLFIKSSATSLEKARILIGKELVDIRSAINTFADDVASMINRTNMLLIKEKGLKKIGGLLSDFEMERNAEHAVGDYLPSLEKKLSELEARRVSSAKDVENARDTAEYKRSLEEKEKAKSELRELQQDIIKLEHEIDLKRLSRIFHNDEKRNRIIRDYAENFEEALNNDENLKIAEMIKEAKPEFDIERLRGIRLKNRELKSRQPTQIEKQIECIEADMKRIDSGILETKRAIEEEKRKKERIGEKNSQILEDIKKEALLLWKNLEILY